MSPRSAAAATRTETSEARVGERVIPLEIRGLNRPEYPYHPTSSIRVHGQEVDEVGPTLAVLVAVAQARRDPRRGRPGRGSGHSGRAHALTG
jgi:hypothetical protein